MGGRGGKKGKGRPHRRCHSCAARRFCSSSFFATALLLPLASAYALASVSASDSASGGGGGSGGGSASGSAF
ncbi:uncharacterized protein DS421_8g248690 [Arachis hypogaea]|nr:uncharacterized protein DS421_8g248690 [Arachis hypogaea]